MIAVTGASLFTAVAVIVAVVGSYLMWLWAEREIGRERKLDNADELQPNLRNVEVHQPFDQDAILTTRPLLPSEYDPARYRMLPDDYDEWSKT